MKTNVSMLLTLLVALGIYALAMPPPQSQHTSTNATDQSSPATLASLDQMPTFRVTVTSRTVQAVNYRHRGGATTLGFKGTDLMPGAHAQEKQERVHRNRGRISWIGVPQDLRQ